MVRRMAAVSPLPLLVGQGCHGLVHGPVSGRLDQGWVTDELATPFTALTVAVMWIWSMGLGKIPFLFSLVSASPPSLCTSMGLGSSPPRVGSPLLSAPRELSDVAGAGSALASDVLSSPLGSEPSPSVSLIGDAEHGDPSLSLPPGDPLHAGRSAT